ncbi:glycosyltransferase [Pantoea stewartii]|uniref:glycosyltransferase n=1 Tax=Pantoea stewartii TaxID=66269 RepID=UPI0019802870|nr:glycosyltransferase [Pantoea stewartii]
MIHRNFDEADAAVIMSVYYKDKPFQLYCSLWSLVNQTADHFVVLITIDGKISNALKLVVNFFLKKYNFIRVINSDINRGLAYSLNDSIEYILHNHPNIEFFFRMDADDISALKRIDLQRSFLKDNENIDILGASCKEFGIYYKTIKKFTYDIEIKQNIIKITPFVHPTVVFRKRVFITGERYPVETHLSEDLAFWLNLALSNYIFHNIPDVVLFYRLNNSTLHRRMGLRKAYSEMMCRFNYILHTKVNILRNTLFSFAHFAIRIMPLALSRVLYKVLR